MNSIRKQNGDFRFGPVAGVVLIVLAFVGLLAICNDNDDGRVDVDRNGAPTQTVPR